MTSGRGELRFDRVRDQTVVVRALATSPLKFLSPRNHGNAAWVFTTNFGGGLVDGDAITIDAEVNAGARAVIGTQAATKVYRSVKGSSQSFFGKVREGGLLAVLNDPLVCFAGARYNQRTNFDLAAHASFVMVDTLASGRVAHGERWAFDHYASRIQITSGDQLLLHDGVHLDALDGEIALRMGAYNALTTVIAMGPIAPAIHTLIEAKSTVKTDSKSMRSEVRSLAPIAKMGFIARVASANAEAAKSMVIDWLKPLIDHLGDDPFSRRY